MSIHYHKWRNHLLLFLSFSKKKNNQTLVKSFSLLLWNIIRLAFSYLEEAQMKLVKFTYHKSAIAFSRRCNLWATVSSTNALPIRHTPPVPKRNGTVNSQADGGGLVISYWSRSIGSALQWKSFSNTLASSWFLSSTSLSSSLFLFYIFFFLAR